MLDRDQDLALQSLAHAIAHCLETVGPVCTARLLGTIALDLTQADGRTDEAETPRPHLGEQDSSEPHEAVSFRHSVRVGELAGPPDTHPRLPSGSKR